MGVGGLQWVRCALGEVVVFHEYRSTRDAGDRGGGCSTPTPRGVIPHRYSAKGRSRQPLCRQCETPQPRSSSCSPCTAIRTIANHCPPPLEGAGGGRASGREAGVIRLFAGKDVPGDMQETGAGNVPSPSPSAPPQGAIPHRYSARGEAGNLSAVNVNTPPRSRSSVPCTVSGQSPCTARPLEGAGGGAERAGRRG